MSLPVVPALPETAAPPQEPAARPRLRPALDATVARHQLRSWQAYEQAWAQHDEEAVRSWLDRCWTPASRYVNPFTDPVVGVEGLAQLIVDYQVLFPDLRIRHHGQVRLHHHYGHARWALTSRMPIRILGRDFGHALLGMDVLVFRPDHLIESVVAFFDDSSEQE